MAKPFRLYFPTFTPSSQICWKRSESSWKLPTKGRESGRLHVLRQGMEELRRFQSHTSVAAQKKSCQSLQITRSIFTGLRMMPLRWIVPAIKPVTSKFLDLFFGLGNYYKSELKKTPSWTGTFSTGTLRPHLGHKVSSKIPHLKQP